MTEQMEKDSNLIYGYEKHNYKIYLGLSDNVTELSFYKETIASFYKETIASPTDKASSFSTMNIEVINDIKDIVKQKKLYYFNINDNFDVNKFIKTFKDKIKESNTFLLDDGEIFIFLHNYIVHNY